MRTSLDIFRKDLFPVPPAEGDLSLIPAYSLISGVRAEGSSGLLTLRRSRRVKQLFFRGGRLLACRSNSAAESLEIFLRRGFLGPDSIPKVSDAENAEAEMVKALYRLLTPERIETLLEMKRREVLLNSLGWFEGTYIFGPEEEVHIKPSAALDLNEFLSDVEAFLSGRPCKGAETCQWPPLSSGDLSVLGGACLLLSYGEHGATGNLYLSRGSRRKRLSWDRGVVTSSASTDPAETLLSVISRLKLLPQEAIRDVENSVRGTGRRLRDEIARRNLLTADKLADALSILRAERILECFSWRTGRFEFAGSFTAPRERPAKEDPVPPASAVTARTQEWFHDTLRAVGRRPGAHPSWVLLPAYDGPADPFVVARAFLKRLDTSRVNALLVVLAPCAGDAPQTKVWRGVEPLEAFAANALPGDVVGVNPSLPAFKELFDPTALSATLAGLLKRFDFLFWMPGGGVDTETLPGPLGRIIWVLPEEEISDGVLERHVSRAPMSRSEGFVVMRSEKTLRTMRATAPRPRPA